MSLFKNKSYIFKGSELGFQVQMNQLNNLLHRTQIMDESMQFYTVVKCVKICDQLVLTLCAQR
jgi:hypothetical protein